jgi:hypothetical protein
VVLVPWIVAGFIVLACLFLDRPPILRHWVLTGVRPWFLAQWESMGIVRIGVSAIAAYYLMLAIHELGHVLAGLCAGFRCRSYRVGPLVISRPFRISLYRGPGAIVNGVAELYPVATSRLALRGVAMVAGGPVANFLSAAAVLLLPHPLSVFSALFIAFSVANGVNDLIPFESRLGVSDGRRIWMLLVQSERGERWLALLHLAGQLSDGVMPESLPTDFLAKAIAVRDASADTVQANAIAFSAAFHQHEDDEAALRLETCLEYSSHATPIFREALQSEAAVFQARRRKRADLAEQWLAGIPSKPQTSWLRARAEAAILEAKGDFDGALGKLSDVEATILTLPSPARRSTLLRLIQRWKSDLRSNA